MEEFGVYHAEPNGLVIKEFLLILSIHCGERPFYPKKIIKKK